MSTRIFLKKFIDEKNINAEKGFICKKKYFDFYNLLLNETKYLIDNINFSERLYHIIHNLYDIPKCLCGEKLFYKSFGKGYGKTCLKKECRIKQQSKSRFGKTHTNETKNKISKAHKGKKLSNETKLKLKGKNKNKNWTEKRKKLHSKKVKYWINENKNKMIEIQKKGVECAKNEKTKEKRKKTLIEKYGVNNSFQLSEYKCKSNISQKLFDNILKKLKIKENVFYGNLNKEICFFNKERNIPYFVDFCDFNSKKIIEFYGDYWHCNPKIYKENYFNEKIGMFAKTKWNYDEEKIKFLKSLNYNIFIIWENDYKINKNGILNKCIEWLNE